MYCAPLTGVPSQQLPLTSDTPSPTVVLRSTQFCPVWILEPLTPTSCTHLSAASCVRCWATGSSASFSPSKNNLLVWRDKRRKKRELASTSKGREEGKNRARCKLVVSPHWLALNEMACKGNGTYEYACVALLMQAPQCRIIKGVLMNCLKVWYKTVQSVSARWL